MRSIKMPWWAHSWREMHAGLKCDDDANDSISDAV